jgi:serine/threonine-protein phosphatase 2A activator
MDGAPYRQPAPEMQPMARPGTPMVRMPRPTAAATDGDAATSTAATTLSGYRAAARAILQPQDMVRWGACETYRAILAFAQELQAAARGKTLRQAAAAASGDGGGGGPITAPVQAALALLARMEGWVDEFPPLPQGMRYGNRAFKLWHARLSELATQLMLEPAEAKGVATAAAAAGDAAEGSDADGGSSATAAAAATAAVDSPQCGALLSTPEHAEASVELASYLVVSFGNETRIDYGSGHELAFTAWMLALRRLGVFGAEDVPALALVLFPRYLRLMRTLQRTYLLEPAGSHGVWGLDDCAPPMPMPVLLLLLLLQAAVCCCAI